MNPTVKNCDVCGKQGFRCYVFGTFCSIHFDILRPFIPYSNKYPPSEKWEAIK